MKADTPHRHLLVTLLAAVGAACTGSPTVQIQGVVVGAAQNQGLAGASVCVGTSNECVTTGAQGDFTLHYSGKAGTALAFNVSAAGYARQSLPVAALQGAWVPVILRPIGSITPVTLSAAGGASVSASVTTNGNTMTLTIPGGSMVDPNGNVATGNANIVLTYWHPLELHTSTPAPLLAENPNSPGGAIPLITWGMGDIEVQQNNTLLNVNPGQHLLWTLEIPPSMQSVLTDANFVPPNLYSVNPNTGLWHYEGNANNGAVALNGNTWVAQLPHLSPWNIDNSEPASAGGCVSGSVVTKTGTPAANTAIIVWYLGDEELKDWHTTTDASGNYCLNTPITTFGSASQYTHYMVSGADAYTDTNMCIPAPANCFTCTYETATAAYGWCSLCRYYDPAFPGTYPDGYGTVSVYQPSCNAAEVTINAGTFCPTGCSAMQTATIGVTGGGAAGTTPCPQVLTEGQACAPGSTTQCCVNPLTCEDYLCVNTAN